MFVFKSNAVYSDNKSVNEVLQILQKKYSFLDKFDSYVSSRLSEYNFLEKGLPPNKHFNQFLSKLFFDYIVLRIHGIVTKESGVSFIDTGLMVTSVRVEYS